MEDARADEIKFFRERPEYTALASAGRVGTAYLAQRLNSLLVMHIKTRLPALRNKLSSSLNSQRKELAALGDAPSGEADDLRKLLISLITQYVESFCTTIDGGRALTSFSELRGGARISQVFNELYPQRLSAIQATEALRPPDIHTTIRNTKGARTALYGSVPQDAFEMLVKKLIRHLREPAAWCVDTVFDELRVISEQCEPPELQRFESLRDKFREVVSELLGRCYKDAKKMMESLISFELAYINTNHPDFVDVGSVLSNAFKNPNGLRQAPPPRTRPAAAAAPNAMGPAPPPAPPGHKDPDVGIGAENILGVSNWFTKGVDNKGRQAPPPQQQAQTNKAQAELTEEVGETKQTVAEWLLQGLESTGMRLDPREQAEMELVVTLICSYFDIVRKNLRDAVPKATMHLMVNQVKK
jgi:dynamin 1-like protein